MSKLLEQKNKIERQIEKYKNKLKKINKKIKHEIEIPMPLEYNIITHKNIEKEKSVKYTKKLIKILKNRRKKKIENIIIKKEVEEEIEIPYLESV